VRISAVCLLLRHQGYLLFDLVANLFPPSVVGTLLLFSKRSCPLLVSGPPKTLDLLFLQQPEICRPLSVSVPMARFSPSVRPRFSAAFSSPLFLLSSQFYFLSWIQVHGASCPVFSCVNFLAIFYTIPGKQGSFLIPFLILFPAKRNSALPAQIRSCFQEGVLSPPDSFTPMTSDFPFFLL